MTDPNADPFLRMLQDAARDWLSPVDAEELIAAFGDRAASDQWLRDRGWLVDPGG